MGHGGKQPANPEPMSTDCLGELGVLLVLHSLDARQCEGFERKDRRGMWDRQMPCGHTVYWANSFLSAGKLFYI